MGYNLHINGIYWGYNPLTKHLLTCWDIQVGLGYHFPLRHVARPPSVSPDVPLGLVDQLQPGVVKWVKIGSNKGEFWSMWNQGPLVNYLVAKMVVSN